MSTAIKRFVSKDSSSILRVRFSLWTVPLALAVLALFGFGLLLPWLGFYWDDWPSVWFNHIQGAAIFKDVFASDRPLLGRLFMLTMPWLGDSILGWQIFGLATRWLTVVAFWGSLRLLWPDRPNEVTWIALLFLIYPGFSQQWIAVTYSHVFLTYAIFFLSFYLMLWAVRRSIWSWYLRILSVLMAGLVMFSHEYFFGLELLRPVFLWIVLAEERKGSHKCNQRQCLQAVALNWLPYLGVVLAFVLWRILIHEFPRAEMSLLNDLKTNTLLAVFQLGKTVLQDIFTAGLSAWGRVLQSIISIDLHSRIDIFSLVLAALTAVGTWLYLANLSEIPGEMRRQSNACNTTPPARGDSDLLSNLRVLFFELRDLKLQKADRGWALQATGIGLFALLVAGWPAWVTALPIRLEFPWDRFTLSMMVGASFLFVGLLGLFFKNQAPKIILVGITVGLAVGFHFQIANTYRKEWDAQKTFFWQLVWRIPGLKPGTTLFTERLPFVYYTDNSLTAPLNWIYAPKNTSLDMQYLMYDNQVRNEDFDGFKVGVAIRRDYRAASFSGNTNQMLVFYYNPPSCLRILEPRIDSKIHKYPPLLYEAMYLTNDKWIELNPQKPALPPVEIFGQEPEHDWCYYFAKASIAQQARDWDQVIAVGEQAIKDGYAPIDPAEYFPFIDAYASLGQWDEAQSMTERILLERPRLVPALCALWAKIGKGAPGAAPVSKTVGADVMFSLGCPNP